MNSLKTIRVSIAVVCLITGIAYLVLSATTVEGIAYKSIDDIRRSGESGVNYRLAGHVKRDSIDRQPDLMRVEFTMIDADSSEIQVRYNGIIPDTFKDGADVVVTGNVDEELFMAFELLAKCPSKYQGGYDTSVSEQSSKS